MKVIKPSYEIINEPDWSQVLVDMERAIRTCYKSEDKIDVGTADKLIRSIIKRGHESTLEHTSLSVRFVCDRGVSHELVRHRHCSFSQESTRYVNYGKEGMQFILPCWIEDDSPRCQDGTCLNVCDGEDSSCEWFETMKRAESAYNLLLSDGWKPEQARSVLPNSLKTELVMTTNLRDWRHIFSLRCDKAAHPQMRELMIPLWEELCEKCPTIFDSVEFRR